VLIAAVKIAILDVNFDHSSSGKIVSILHDELAKQGHYVKSFYGRGPKVRKLNVHKISSKLEFLFHVIATRLTGLVDIFSPFSTNKLIKFLDTFKPDLIHLHELHGYYINTYKLLKYLKEKKIPIIWTFHCEYMFTGKCGFAENCNKWKTECNQCPKLREYPSSLFFDFTKLLFYKKKKILTEIDKIHFTAPTNWLADRMLQSIIKNKSISVVPNAVDLSIFKNNKDLISKEDLNISKK
jgi:putative colanic acid biosynthesis glycosyltransferase